MKTKLKEFIIMFCIQVFSYGMLCINYRAVALANIPLAAITDFVIASFNFFIIKKIASSDDSFHEWLGYALGGVVGSVIGIYYSDLLLNLIQ